jgi:hypothetical protein
VTSALTVVVAVSAQLTRGKKIDAAVTFAERLLQSPLRIASFAAIVSVLRSEGYSSRAVVVARRALKWLEGQAIPDEIFSALGDAGEYDSLLTACLAVSSVRDRAIGLARLSSLLSRSGNRARGLEVAREGHDCSNQWTMISQ